MLPHVGGDSLATHPSDNVREASTTPFSDFLTWRATPRTFEEFPSLHPAEVDTTDYALESAKEKVRTKAAHYDRGRSGNFFSDSKSLDPEEVRYILRFIFGIVLTNEEHAALMYMFDKDGDGVIDNAEFQLAFFRLAKEGKERMKHAQMERNKLLEEKRARHEDRLRATLLKRKQTKLCDFNDADLARVQEQTAKVAELYDTTEGVGPGLKVFEGGLTPSQFREQLRRSLDMKLDPAEFSALFHEVDKDGSGTVEGAEFKFEFLRLRRKGVLRAKKDFQEANVRISKRMRDLESYCLRRFNQNYQATVDKNYTEADTERVREMISKVAAHFDHRDYRNQINVRAFQARLDATAFEEQLIRSFDIRLNPRELGALMDAVDLDRSGFVEGHEFWILFVKEGEKERERERQHELAMRQRREQSIQGFLETRAKNIKKNMKAQKRKAAVAGRAQEDVHVIKHMEYRCDNGLSISGGAKFATGRPAVADVPIWEQPASSDTGLERLLQRTMVASTPSIPAMPQVEAGDVDE